jgi:hypothetical protein
MLSSARSSQAADHLRHLPPLNTDTRVLLQVLGMDQLAQAEFCNSLTSSNDALIISELKPAPDLPPAVRVSMCEQALRLLAADMVQPADAAQ